jgi:hypothetical protein
VRPSDHADKVLLVARAARNREAAVRLCVSAPFLAVQANSVEAPRGRRGGLGATPRDGTMPPRSRGPNSPVRNRRAFDSRRRLAGSFKAQDAALRTRRRGLNSFSGHHAPHARWTRATVLTWSHEVRFPGGVPSSAPRLAAASVARATPRVLLEATRSGTSTHPVLHADAAPRFCGGRRGPRRGKDEQGVQRTATAPRRSATTVRIRPSPPILRKAALAVGRASKARTGTDPTAFDSLAFRQPRRGSCRQRADTPGPAARVASRM